MERLVLPPDLVEEAHRQGREDWLARLPGTVASLTDRWSLTLESPYVPGGQSAWVAPVRAADGTPLVLKVCWPHPEAIDEAAGLREWDGDGCVRVHDAVALDEGTALLLERCEPGTTLRRVPETEQDLVLAGLLHRLWRPPLGDHPFRPLESMCNYWADRFEALPPERRPALDAGLVRRGIELLRELPTTAPRRVLLCTDLHAGNVLAAEREPWLVIDPKPYIGDPTYDALQHLLNCDARLRSEPEALVRRVAGLFGLDEERLRLWLFARCVQQSADWPHLIPVARRLAPD